jgi:predicted dehydrogenase
MATNYRWGIIGTGNIAAKFATCLAVCEGATLHAVASRSQEGADAFGDRFKIPVRHASYEALANDPDVDVVYISTPHALHMDNCTLCLRAGKAVLCEKPFTLNAAESRAVIEVAREMQKFIMEGMWTRFFPVVKQAEAWIVEGVIGEPRMVRADFGFRMDYGDRGRLWDLRLGGGSLLDVGIYPITIASLAFQAAPTDIHGFAHVGEYGVDEQAAFVLGYSGGRLATLSSAIRTKTNWDAYIHGETGTIKIHSPFWQPSKVTLIPNEGEEQSVEIPLESLGFEYEIREVMACLDQGLLECPAMPHARTVEVMEVMDKLRRQWSLHYPGERVPLKGLRQPFE